MWRELGARPRLRRVWSRGLCSPPSRTVYEDSGPGRPLSCFMEEPAPYTDGPGAAAGGGNCRFVESPSQDQRLQAQRLRNPEVRGSLQTPQNRPHGHQSPELPEGYGEGARPPFHLRSATCPSPVSDLFWYRVPARTADVCRALPHCVSVMVDKSCSSLMYPPLLQASRIAIV